MKKIFGVVLLSVISLSFLVAQEEDESSFGKPSFSLENETTIKGAKSGEKETKGNFVLSADDFENETTAKFSVGFAIGENFKLTPYVSDSVVTGMVDAGNKFAVIFKKNSFGIGLGASYKPIDMLSIKFGLGYVSRYSLDDKWDGQSLGNGVKFNVGLGLSVDSIFLEAGLGYKFDGMFANETKEILTDVKKLKYGKIKNVITLDATFDFFNFIKEGLNSGLVLSNETKISSGWQHLGRSSEKADYDGDKKIENEFGIGLHFAPIDYLDFTFLVKVASEAKKAYVYNPIEKTGKYEDGDKSTAVGLSLGLAFSKDMFSFGIEYNPVVSAKTTDKDGKVTEEKNLEHEFKIAVGIEL